MTREEAKKILENRTCHIYWDRQKDIPHFDDNGLYHIDGFLSKKELEALLFFINNPS